MILIDALYINNSGGKVLLDYLIDSLEDTNEEFFYLLDKRIEGNTPKIKEKNNVLYIKANLYNRYKFYTEHKKSFNKVLCFGNLPPNIKLKTEVYTYFHQLLYLEIPRDLPIKERLILNAKVNVLNLLKRNTDFWMVQTSEVQKQLSDKFKINKKNILILPFYEQSIKKEIQKEPFSYLYVSNGSSHKNHLKLIEAFSLFYLKHKKGKLILTIPENQTNILSLINEKIKLGVNIHNIGFVPKNELEKVYQKSEFLIFPSLSESFGLGIIEGIEHDCKVIGANLPYMYAVCKPSITFNPYKEEFILEALETSINHEIKKSISIVKNEINTIIDILINKK